MGIGFSYRDQLLTVQDRAVGFLVKQFDELTAGLSVLAPLCANLKMPYVKSGTLFTDSTGIPTLHVQTRASISRSSAQVITTGTVTTLSFDQVRFDIGPMWSAALPTRLTVPLGGAGLYLVTATVPWAANVAGTFRQIRIMQSRASVAPFMTTAPGAGIMPMQWLLLVPAIVGDYFEIDVLHDVGGNLNAGDGSNARIELSAMKLAAA